MDKLIKTLPKVIAAAGGSEEVAEAACAAAWNHALGEVLSSHALPGQLANKTLVIAVRDNIWQRQLEDLRPQLLYRLNSVLGQEVVKSIEVRIEPARFKKLIDHASVDEHGTAAQAVPIELVSAAAGIQDASLRRAFLGAAVSCVNRLDRQGDLRSENLRSDL